MSEGLEAPPFRPPDSRMIPESHPLQLPATGHPRAYDEPPGEPITDELVVRPFVLTGGRTRPTGTGLRVETLIQATPEALSSTLRFEARRIVEVCRQPNSLAEIAAVLAVPFGVARVLVADLVALGTVTVVRSDELSIQTIERVRDRVRSL